MVKNTDRETELRPDTLLKQILARKMELEHILKEKEKQIKKAPDGNLRFIMRDGYIQYYHKHNHSIPNGDYLKRKQNSLAAALAQKDYDIKLIRELKAEIKVLNKTLVDYQPKRLDDVLNLLHDVRKSLIHPVILSDKDYITRWLSVEYERKPFEENAPDYFTANGERVRSKSEVLIADALRRHNIPYRYEYPLHIPGHGIVYPDFICLNVRERKVYIWEHNGMMSDPDYASYAIKRIDMYSLAGYTPGDSLILSFESVTYPLSSRMIDWFIRKYLL